MPKEFDYLTFDCDMNSGGTLRIFKQDDGDIILSISTEHSHAFVELCAPFTGGGRHERLWHTLAKFFAKEMTYLEKHGGDVVPRTRAD